jgi:hypothetical protein
MARRMAGLSHHLRGEAAKMLTRFGPTVILVHVAIIGVFSILVPWLRGVDFLDPVTTSAYACLGVLLSAPAAAQAFLLDRPSSLNDALARIGIAVLYGESMALVILLGAFTTIYTTTRFAFAPDLLTLGESLALGLTASLALSSVAAFIALRFSPGIARNAMRVIFLLLLYLFFQKSRWLPDVAVQGSIMSVGVAILAIFAIRRQLPAGVTAHPAHPE